MKGQVKTDPSSGQKYHQAVSGDTCQVIVDKYRTFSLADFYKWNPAVGSSCSSLWIGYYYCIAVKGTPTTPPPTTPTPVQAGITAKCKFGAPSYKAYPELCSGLDANR